ncbi:hypothetical protein GCM10009806_12070 [Microbacterium flavum]
MGAQLPTIRAATRHVQSNLDEHRMLRYKRAPAVEEKNRRRIPPLRSPAGQAVNTQDASTGPVTAARSSSVTVGLKLNVTM